MVIIIIVQVQDQEKITRVHQVVHDMIYDILDDWLLSAYVNISNECNLNCTYCSASSEMEKKSSMSYDDFLFILRKLEEKKVGSIILTGGEPFLCKDIEKIISLSVVKHNVSVLTNGTLITRYSSFLEQIEKKSRLKFAVSVDSVIEEKNRLTRGDGSLNKAISGILCLKQMGYYVAISATVTSSTTKDDIEKIIEWAIEKELNSVSISLVLPFGKAGRNYDEFKTHFNLIQEINELMERKSYKNIPIGFSYKNPIEAHEGEYRFLTCGAGRTQISIMNDGTVYPCNGLKICMGNIYKDSWQWILEKSDGAKLIKEYSNTYVAEKIKCEFCDKKKYCSGGCRAAAFEASGDLYAQYPFCGQVK